MGPAFRGFSCAFGAVMAVAPVEEPVSKLYCQPHRDKSSDVFCSRKEMLKSQRHNLENEGVMGCVATGQRALQVLG